MLFLSCFLLNDVLNIEKGERTKSKILVFSNMEIFCIFKSYYRLCSFFFFNANLYVLLNAVL